MYSLVITTFSQKYFGLLPQFFQQVYAMAVITT